MPVLPLQGGIFFGLMATYQLVALLVGNRSARLSSMTPLADVVGVTCPSALHGTARVAVNAIGVEAARCNARRQGFVYA